ncbi:glutaredoxin family protein [Pseudalkalibacillus berkeleyi]|uniref:Glutaredoxin family protein n=1 Tax=Pseudalkalibacillus berkeleyi TaxID=1069813 RepID=A0ABS9GXC3_9BACL|nr:glutaredoxin family protein [Pseudalkalibacillus berkeleyi]MCF6137427.1 glutaredoxin family protein [Pseudalkalibacillus berkeleyi]
MHNTPVVYTINSCSRCQKVKNYLEELNITFNERNLSETPRYHKDLQDSIGEVYVPIIIYGNCIIKGDQLEEINKMIHLENDS